MSNFPSRDAAEAKMADLDNLEHRIRRVDQSRPRWTVAAKNLTLGGEGEFDCVTPSPPEVRDIILLGSMIEAFDAVPKSCVWEDYTLDDARDE